MPRAAGNEKERVQDWSECRGEERILDGKDLEGVLERGRPFGWMRLSRAAVSSASVRVACHA